jgi:hypothetical protein
MSFSIKERMTLALKVLDTWRGWPLEAKSECTEGWTRDYAILYVSIDEPDDNIRCVFDLDAARDKVVEAVHAIVGKRAHIIKGKASKKDLQKPLVLHVHLLPSGWDMELEAYRPKKVLTS